MGRFLFLTSSSAISDRETNCLRVRHLSIAMRRKPSSVLKMGRVTRRALEPYLSRGFEDAKDEASMSDDPDFQKADYVLQVLRRPVCRATKQRQKWLSIWRM